MTYSSSLALADEELAGALKVLGSTTRLRVLAAIKQPTPVREIRVQPESSRAGSNPDRPVSIQVVQSHLKRLADLGLVSSDEVGRTHVVHRPRLYALAESFRQLALLQGDHAVPDDRTIRLGHAAQRPAARGPRLMLVHGAYEGKAFALDEHSGGGPWIVGRLPGLAVCLDYDPYVSREHAVVQEGPRGFVIRNAPGSRNGTFVNWQPLAHDTDHPLVAGDVIGVGRSLLVFANS